MICPICKREIGCDCQMRTLTTGMKVCINCAQQEQQKINQQNTLPTP